MKLSKIFFTKLLSLGVLLGLQPKAQAADFTTAATTPTKVCDASQLESCFTDHLKANHAFVLHHVQKTEYSVLLVHGLSDSPYYMKDLGQSFFKMGMNVIGIRLSGHGTTEADLAKVSTEDWIADIDYGVKRAQALGKKVVIAGFSTGGALAVSRIQRAPQDIAGLVLIAPALKFPGMLTGTSCGPFKPLTTTFAPFLFEKSYGAGVRYNKISTEAICQVYRLTNQIALKAGGVVTDETDAIARTAPGFKQIQTPVFMALTGADDAIDLKYALSFAGNVSGPKQVIYYAQPGDSTNFLTTTLTELNLSTDAIKVRLLDKPVPHAGFLLKTVGFGGENELNTDYSFLEQRMLRFVIHKMIGGSKAMEMRKRHSKTIKNRDEHSTPLTKPVAAD